MPHISVKMYTGRSEEQKRAITDALTAAMMASSGCSDASLSIAIEDVDPADWAETVYKPEIEAHSAHLYKKPGYGPT
ncbi:tautomerase family protein [Oryzicola mucosus]|uniref:Tautomerase family protein n=1 Tax=Oryzicola mucosus TaxID=2767425 RepID=A0A8J6Q1W0_9HYPH|nr:tautomerase family protein [Oryzicola mucosus]MBD0414815.1 tautomerase family protein [Oryzicola mucosus]